MESVEVIRRESLKCPSCGSNTMVEEVDAGYYYCVNWFCDWEDFS